VETSKRLKGTDVQRLDRAVGLNEVMIIFVFRCVALFRGITLHTSAGLSYLICSYPTRGNHQLCVGCLYRILRRNAPAKALPHRHETSTNS